MYVSVNGQLGACDALRELGLQGKVHLICHDLIPANAENVRRGLIDFLIDQDAALQGARPIELLMDYLLAGEKPETDRILACIDKMCIRDRAKPTVEKLTRKGWLLGDEHGKLDLTEELLRTLVINDRAGIYGE